MNSAIDVMDEIKAKLVAATTPGVDRGKMQEEITQLQNQLQSTSDSATFNGQNWLNVGNSTAAGYNATRSIVASFTRDGTGAMSIRTVDVERRATPSSTTRTALGSRHPRQGPHRLRRHDRGRSTRSTSRR